MLFKCTFPGSDVTSKRKRNSKWHQENCETQKKKKASSKKISHCQATFCQKYNRQRYTKNLHLKDAVSFVENVEGVMEITCDSQNKDNEEIINASIAF